MLGQFELLSKELPVHDNLGKFLSLQTFYEREWLIFTQKNNCFLSFNSESIFHL